MDASERQRPPGPSFCLTSKLYTKEGCSPAQFLAFAVHQALKRQLLFVLFGLPAKGSVCKFASFTSKIQKDNCQVGLTFSYLRYSFYFYIIVLAYVTLHLLQSLQYLVPSVDYLYRSKGIYFMLKDAFLRAITRQICKTPRFILAAYGFNCC